ncbi:MAG: phosphotransferase [Hallerella sp.]|uniref:aminoglycoside phosphotransferase family protein n=1 Tax=Hallerella sp. TaxID=2815812 RepID=UPI0025865782|nr:phosphotransferase [Hallerella sp.]MCI5601175.1 phosphotransferase [Hallerella sp.]
MTNIPVSSQILRVIESRGFSSSSTWTLAGSAGSGRKYYRVSDGEKTAILQTNASANEDFEHFVSFGKSFSAFSLPTPEIYAVDEESAQILMQDMGEQTLLSQVVKDGAPISGSARVLYPVVIDALIRWQVSSPKFFLSRPDIAARRFDYAALKWETDYFKTNYLQKKKGIAEIPQVVENFFATLACMVDTHPKVLMHRDFQSQNVMVRSSSEVGFVDFQGALRGSLFYDIASLLWDPYVSLPEEMVVDFFDEWFRDYPLVSESFSREEAWTLFLQAALQRLMQAMGAFCFLLTEKKIESFEQYIEPGKKRLLRVLELYEPLSPSRHEAITFLKNALA